VLVKFKPGFSPTSTFLKTYGLSAPEKVLGQFKLSGDVKNAVEQVGLNRLYKLKIKNSKKNPVDVAANISKDISVAYAEPNYIVRALGTIPFPENIPEDDRFDDQWGLEKIEAPEAWTVATDATLTPVGIIDSGIDLDHPDLVNNIWVNVLEANGQPGVDDDNNGFVDDINGWNFINNTPSVEDGYGHGTMVAGIIGAEGNNDIGISGVAWRARLASLKFIGADGSGTVANAIRAIEYANLMGFRVTNNSWGATRSFDTPGVSGIGNDDFNSLKDAIFTTNILGNLFITAAGDLTNGIYTPNYPSHFGCPTTSLVQLALQNNCMVNVISVTSTNQFDDIVYGANYDTWNNPALKVHLGAPGIGIVTTEHVNNALTFAGGTSMATAFVSGATALHWSLYPESSYLGVREALLNTVDGISLQGAVISDGRLNLKRFLTLDLADISSI